MYCVDFDSEDSLVFSGSTLYFNKKENIFPYVEAEAKKRIELLKEYGYETVEDYFYEYYRNGQIVGAYIHEIKTED